MMSGPKLDFYFETALELTKKAGQLVRSRIWSKKSVETKSCAIDLVTETDKQVEELLVNGIKEKFPDHKFIGEETVSAGGKCEYTDDPTWIIDPVDGTMNFVHGFPHCCISVAFHINKQAKIGIIYNPTLEQLFTARAGVGAFYNGRQIHVSGETEISKALLMFEAGTSRDPERMENVRENFKNLVPVVHGIRGLGSAALNMAMVALGAADVNFEFGIHAWDVAAGDLIVREAGGVCIDPSGGPLDILSRRVLAASSEELAKSVIEKLHQHYPPRD